MKIDADKLAKIADAAKKENQKQADDNRAREAKRRQDQKTEAEKKAKEIIASIPKELEKAAKRAVTTKKGLLITAMIPIVREKFSSEMDSRGWLREEDELVLKAVRKLLNGLTLEGVKLSEVSEEREGGWQAADGDTTSGPCRHYFIKAETLIKKDEKKK